jgi:hypothetical protein
MKKLSIAALAALLATSSMAFAQTASTGPAVTGTTNTTGAAARGSDPGVTDRNAAQDSPTAAETRLGSGTPGNSTTGAGIAPSDRAVGSKSGG